MSSYRVAKLSEVAEVGAGNSAPQKKELFHEGTHPFVRTSDVGQIRFGTISTAADLLNDKGIKGLRLVPKGTILLPKSGASTFLNHRVETLIDCYVSSHLATVTAHPDKAIPRYLLYFLSTVQAQDLIQDHKYPSLTLGVIGSIEVSLPPLEEQKRIVAVLDQAFAALDRARALAEANLADAEVLTALATDALCKNACSSWVTEKMGNYCTFEGGFAFKSGDAVDSSDVQIIRIGNLYKNVLDLDRSPAFYPSEFSTRYARFKLYPGDIIMSLTGTVGKQDYGFAVEVPKTERALLLNQRVARITPKNRKILSNQFLLRFLRSESFLSRLYRISRGTRQANLSTKDIADLEMTIPPLSDQLDIVEQLEKIEAQTGNLRQTYLTQREDLSELRQSLLQKAFAGELT